MPRVICCGPESSGTRLLTTIVEAMGLDAVHRSMPHGEQWWNAGEFADARFVVIVRRIDATTKSAVAARHVRSAEQHRLEWSRAINTLAAIRGAYWICYEALAASPQIQIANLAAWLGVETPRELPNIVDGNAKWNL